MLQLTHIFSFLNSDPARVVSYTEEDPRGLREDLQSSEAESEGFWMESLTATCLSGFRSRRDSRIGKSGEFPMSRKDFMAHLTDYFN